MTPEERADAHVEAAVKSVEVAFLDTLRVALAPMLSEYDVHSSHQFGPLTVFVDEQGFHTLRMGATISVFKQKTLLTLEEILKKRDPHHAGREIMGCYSTQAKVNCPAVNVGAPEALHAFNKAAQFTLIVNNGQQYLENLLFRKHSFVGALFLDNKIPNPSSRPT